MKPFNTVIPAALFLLLMGHYLLTYRGWPMSGDEVFLYDSAVSLARRGTLDRVYEYNTIVQPPNQLRPGVDGAPWLPPVQEPLMPALVAPLVWIGQALPEVGTMHLAWLLNLAITALTAVSLYAIARWWGCSVIVGVVLALAFGLGSNAWFYSRLLFREPLNAFLLLWAFAFAVALSHSWKTGKVDWRIVLGLIVSIILAFLTKVASLLFLPALVIVLLPPLSVVKTRRQLLLGFVLGGGIAFVLLFIIMSNGLLGARYSLSTWTYRLATIQWAYVLESVLGYQISFGRSLWLYSPVLLAGIVGAFLWIGQGGWRVVIGPLVSLLLLSVWYGITLTVDWLGGWGWGPRYLLPLIPVLMLWTLPAIARLTTPLRRLAFGGLVILGAAVQLLGMAVPISNYFTDLFRSGKIYDYALVYSDRAGVDAQWGWMDATWTWQWSPQRYHLTRLDFAHLDFAWAVVDHWIAPLLALAGAGLAGWVLWYEIRANTQVRPYRRALVLLITSALIWLAATAAGLWALRNDPRVIGEWNDVAALVEALNERVEDDAAVFIDRHLYTPIFMNFFKPPALVATLPYAPGESYGPEGPAVVSDVLEVQVGAATVYALDWSAEHYHDLWLIASTSPFEADKRRPIERYLAEHYFPVEEISTSSRARAIRFAPVRASEGQPEQPASVVFGDGLNMIGYDLPLGDTIAAGEALPVSLVWQPQAPLDFDYNIGLYLLHPDGTHAAQRDGQPQGTFGQMTRWPLNQPQRDNHALLIPPDLPPGDYRLALAVYQWENQTRLPALGAGIDPASDQAILAIITIRQ